MAKARRKRNKYTPEQRSKILAAAAREHLTAEGVKKKFGVTPVTYYSWRKKSGATRARGRGRARIAARSGAIGGVRMEVANHVRRVLPGIIRSEVSSYLNTLFTNGPSRRRGQHM